MKRGSDSEKTLALGTCCRVIQGFVLACFEYVTVTCSRFRHMRLADSRQCVMDHSRRGLVFASFVSIYPPAPRACMCPIGTTMEPTKPNQQKTATKYRISSSQDEEKRSYWHERRSVFSS